MLFSFSNEALEGGYGRVSAEGESGWSGENVPHENTCTREGLMGNSNIAHRCAVATMSARRRIN